MLASQIPVLLRPTPLHVPRGPGGAAAGPQCSPPGPQSKFVRVGSCGCQSGGSRLMRVSVGCATRKTSASESLLRDTRARAVNAKAEELGCASESPLIAVALRVRASGRGAAPGRGAWRPRSARTLGPAGATRAASAVQHQHPHRSRRAGTVPSPGPGLWAQHRRPSRYSCTAGPDRPEPAALGPIGCRRRRRPVVSAEPALGCPLLSRALCDGRRGGGGAGGDSDAP